jgi:tetratricopeptide (TPR) repeat protein
LFNEILRLEPDSPAAHTGLAFRHAAAARYGWSKDKEKSLTLLEMHADKAIAQNEGYSGGYIAKAWLRLVQGRVTEGIALGEKAVQRAPSDSAILGILAILYQKDMQADVAIHHFERATRVDPLARGWVWENYGEALQMAGRYEESIPVFERGLKFSQGFIITEIYLGMAVSYDALDRQDEGKAAVEEAVKATPKVNVSYMNEFQRYKDQDYKQRWISALVRMGLPTQ